MALPAGFKVDDGKLSASLSSHVPPRVKKIMVLLDLFPESELLSTNELMLRLGMTLGSNPRIPILAAYCEKVDGKLFWGSPATITNLRAQLNSNAPQDGRCDPAWDDAK